ncbi:MAG: histidine kinase [Acidobacteria bacterium]|nr:histidine kinase [Acidobacteriota bacterium]MBI3280686.1 histidine kinase [Acidobacteriota bacterium]
MLEQRLVTLLLKLAVAASLASFLARFGTFKRILLREERTLLQRLQFALGLSAIFGAGVATRVVTGGYAAVDLGLEGSLLAGLLGGYVTGLISGVLIALPATAHGELLAMPLFAGVGVLGALVRDVAPKPEEVWRFSPLDLGLFHLSRQNEKLSQRLFHTVFLAAILFSEFLRWVALQFFGPNVIFSIYSADDRQALTVIAVYAATVFAVTLPLKIWNNARNEDMLERQQRLLNEARLAALTRQINPHFLFNTLNSISSLVRLDPERARSMIYKLSNILRRAMRHEESLCPLRDELAFIDDYMGIEITRFGDKLRFVKEIDPGTLDLLVPGMVLQPLIENSIRHGLSSKVDGGMIRVRSRLGDGRVHLSVEDDGVGIPESKLASLFEQGIGISNVNERLKVLFGNDYRMWIDSKPGRGTQTEIEIPQLRPAIAAA